MLPFSLLLYMLYFDSETALAACISRATSQQLKNRQLFEEKNCIRMTLLEEFLTSK